MEYVACAPRVQRTPQRGGFEDAVKKDLEEQYKPEYKQGPGSPVACCRLESTVSIGLSVNFHTEELAGQVLVTKA